MIGKGHSTFPSNPDWNCPSEITGLAFLAQDLVETSPVKPLDDPISHPFACFSIFWYFGTTQFEYIGKSGKPAGLNPRISCTAVSNSCV